MLLLFVVSKLTMRKKIRDVVKRGALFQRLRIFDCETYFAIISEEKEFGEHWGESIRIEITAKRLEQLANDILNYLDRKVKWGEWKPSMSDLEVRLRQTSPKYGIETWFIDWIRHAVTMKDKDDIKQARLIYEWLRGNEKWLYEVDINDKEEA